MARTDFKSVDEYIATHPADVQSILQRVRGVIRKTLPEAEEVISYQMPAYRLHGRIAIFFAAWKEHYSIYPATEPVASALAEELAPYEVTKGTIRFPLSGTVPVKLIERIAKLRGKDAAERAALKRARSRPKARSSGATAGAKKRSGSSRAKRPRTGASRRTR